MSNGAHIAAPEIVLLRSMDNAAREVDNGYAYNHIIRLEHQGAYVAKFHVTWNEVSIDPSGKVTKVARAWPRNGKHFTSGWSEEIAIKENSTDVHVMAQEYTGLVWERVRTIFDYEDVPLISWRVFHVFGSTLGQNYFIRPPLE